MTITSAKDVARINEECDRRHRERIAGLGVVGMGGHVQALFPKPRASSPARLRDLTEEILRDTPRSAFGLCCFKDSHFDPRKAHRLISGIAIGSGARNGNGNVFVAKGMKKCSLPTPLLYKHERLIGRVTNTFVFGEVVRFQAELANTGSSFAARVWNDIVGRRLDAVSVGAINLSGNKIVDGTYMDWGVKELSIALLGADDGAVIDRCWERESGVFLGHAPVKLHWEGPLSEWDVATGNMYLPRESDEPEKKKESDIAIAASLSTKLRAELKRLKT